MQISLAALSSPDEFEEAELRARSAHSTKSKLTLWYKALDDSEEIAFVAIDRWRALGRLVLYELFVPFRLRGQGYGSAVLDEVERLAAAEGFECVRLSPGVLDGRMDQQQLEDWYRRRGYEDARDETG